MLWPAELTRRKARPDQRGSLAGSAVAFRCWKTGKAEAPNARFEGVRSTGSVRLVSCTVGKMSIALETSLNPPSRIPMSRRALGSGASCRDIVEIEHLVPEALAAATGCRSAGRRGSCERQGRYGVEALALSVRIAIRRRAGIAGRRICIAAAGGGACLARGSSAGSRDRRVEVTNHCIDQPSQIITGWLGPTGPS